MSILATVDLNRNLRTGDGTEGTPLAFSILFPGLSFDKGDRVVPSLVKVIGRLNQLMGADRYTEFAILAKFRIDFDVGCNQCFLRADADLIWASLPGFNRGEFGSSGFEGSKKLDSIDLAEQIHYKIR